MVQHNKFRGSAWHDRALDFHGPVDFAEHAIEAGAHVEIDQDTGKISISTEMGNVKLSGDAVYSYTQKRAALAKLAIIGIPAVLLCLMLALPFLSL